MDQLVNFVNAYSGTIAFIALSIGISFYWIRNSYYRRKKFLSYGIKNGIVPDQSNQKIKRSLILFWNCGREVIRYDDFASQGPLQVVSNRKLYNAELLGSSDEYSQVMFNETSGGFSVAPEYIDKNDAFILGVDHEAGAKLLVEGKLIGGKMTRARSVRFWYVLNFTIHLLTSMLIFFGFICFCLWLIKTLNLQTNYNGTYDWLIFPIYITVAMLGIYLTASFDYNIGKVHRLVTRFF